MAASHAEEVDAVKRRRGLTTPPVTPVALACAGGGPAIDAVLVDVSTFGCRVHGDGADAVGNHVRLAMGDRPPIAATVMWRDGPAIACRFDKPIATSVMRSLICGNP